MTHALTDQPDRRATLPPSGKPGPSEIIPLGSRYVLEYPIGRGASGRVWHGRRRSDGTPVAIKVLREEYTADPEVVTRFMRERTSLQALDHHHLVRVCDLVVEGDTVAVVMELVDGQDLRAVAKNGGLQTDETLTVTTQVAHALAYIHDAGVVHRDVKPENILVGGRGGQIRAQLADFGLAWVADGRRLTRSSHMVGTPAYLAPELLAGRGYGPPVDVYALGVTAYELLCGRRPFGGEHPLALMRAHLDEDPQRGAGLSDEAWDVLSACLSKRPQDRPTAAELATRFEVLRDASVRLGIDFGTSNTTAVLRWSDGRTDALRFDGSPLLPCAVFAQRDGTLLSGREAMEAARHQPQSFEPYPKLRINDGRVWVGGQEFDVVDLVAAVLRRVAEEAEAVAGSMPARVTMTHPSSWGKAQRDVLDRAAQIAGLPAPQMIAEPVAAAAHLVGSAPAKVPAGAVAVIYDLGAASVTASVLRRTANGGFDVLASEGLPDAGGIDIDAAILSYLDEIFSRRDPERWRRLCEPDNDADRRSAWQLWVNVRRAKEILSRSDRTTVHIPLIDRKIDLDRRQLEELAEPTLHRTLDATVAAARAAFAAAGVAPDDVAATFLIGGSSRIPLAASLLRRALGAPPTQVKHPELAVAEGSLHLTARPAPGKSVAARPRNSPRRWVSTSPADALFHRPRRPTIEPRRPRDRRGRPHDAHIVRGGRAGGWREVLRRWGHRPRWQVVAASVSLLLVVITAISQATSSPSRGAGAAAGPGGPCGQKIAFLGYLSADRIGVSVRNAVALAVDQYNQAHSDCTVELVDYNTFKPDSADNNRQDNFAVRHAEAIAEDGSILGVVGPTNYDEAVLALPVLEQAGVAVISPMVTHDEIAESGYLVFHRTVASHEVDVAAGIRHLTGPLKATKVFVVGDAVEGSQVATESIAEATRALGTRVAGTGTLVPTADPTALVELIKSSGADAVYFTGWYASGAVLVKQLRAAQVNVTLMGSQRLFDQNYVTRAGKEVAEGTYVTCPCTGETVRTFESQYKARYNRNAPYYAPEAFDAATVLLSGLAAGKATRADMLSWVDSYDSPGVARHIRFTEDGDLDPARASAWLYRIENGFFSAEAAIADP